MRKVRSAKGEIVDFDLIDIKQQMANIPTHVSVALRQQYIDEKTTKAKRQAAEVPDYIKSAPWNVLSAEENQHGDVEVELEPSTAEADPEVKKPAGVTVSTKRVR